MIHPKHAQNETAGTLPWQERGIGQDTVGIDLGQPGNLGFDHLVPSCQERLDSADGLVPIHGVSLF